MTDTFGVVLTSFVSGFDATSLEDALRVSVGFIRADEEVVHDHEGPCFTGLQPILYRVRMRTIGRTLTAATVALAASCVSGAPDVGDSPAMNGTLDLLKKRAEYEKLGKAAVETLSHAAEARWASQFSEFTYQRVEHFSAGGKSHWMAIWLHGKTGLEFVLTPGGRFQMGSPESEPGRQDHEKQNWVTLDPFLIARTECTQAIWAKLAGKADLNADPSYFEGSSAHPVEQVSAEEVDTWCNEAGLVLPTQAQWEWEFACRAGTTFAYTFGSRLSPTQARTGTTLEDGTATIDVAFEAGPISVGSLSSNPFGLFDVHGNLWEWCRDFYLDYGVQAEEGSGLRSGLSASRVIRGGTFSNPALVARSAARARYLPKGSSRLMGFRPSLDLPF